jgi:hypothetical protein
VALDEPTELLRGRVREVGEDVRGAARQQGYVSLDELHRIGAVVEPQPAGALDHHVEAGGP